MPRVEGKDDLSEKNLSAKAETKQKKPRRIAIRDASFRLYKINKDNGSLSRMGVFETLPEIVGAYGKALDEGIPQEQLEGHKTKILKFRVREIERRVVAS